MPNKQIIDIPNPLVEAVKNGTVVLFLGAGASMEAKDKNGARAPSAPQLAKAMSEKFLGEDVSDLGLMQTAEICIGRSTDSNVFGWVSEQFQSLKPSEPHLALPSFRWATIATTNYDTLVEDAYAQSKEPAQNILRFVKDRDPIEMKRSQVDRPLNLLKIHGCIDHAYDSEIPLILDNAHYERFDLNRKRLFNRLEDLAQEMPFLFIGYKLSDPHIQNLIHRLDRVASRPEFYVVAPGVPSVMKDHWRSKRIVAIDGKFGGFMKELDAAVPSLWRKVSVGSSKPELPLRRHFKTNSDPSAAVLRALDNELVHVHSGMKLPKQNARDFYKGYDIGFSCIASGHDVRRRVTNDLILHLIEKLSAKSIEICLLSGPAGSGKTTAIKRVAWEVSNEFDAPVFWCSDIIKLDYGVLEEIYNLTGKRLYLFVDRISEFGESIGVLLAALKSADIPITLVSADREFSWNLSDTKIDKIWKPTVFSIGRLVDTEIEDLIMKMKTHSSLGVLTSMKLPEQIAAFNAADGHLLVALHEVTRGKPFEEIILDEVNSLQPEKAKQLYLDICTLHQFGSPVRAGLINRISGIPFSLYEMEFFQPLEGTVIAERNRYTGDFLYRARHQRVASLAFRKAFPNDHDRIAQLERVIAQLDEGYSSDSETINELIKAREITKLVSSLEAANEVYQRISELLGERWYIEQQRAILQLHHIDGNLEKAEELAQRALHLEPGRHSVLHTLAEISRVRASQTTDPNNKTIYRKQARDRLAKIPSQRAGYADGTKCKLRLDEMRDASKNINLNDDNTIEEFNTVTELAKNQIDRSVNKHPADPEILRLRADYYGLLNDNDNVRKALEKAWMLNSKGVSVGLRLNRVYLNEGKHEKAMQILTELVEKNPIDVSVNFALARFNLSEYGDFGRAAFYLTRSYTSSDRNYVARFQHAQYLFAEGDGESAAELFSEIDRIAPPEYMPKSDFVFKEISQKIGRVRGRLVSLNDSFCFMEFPSFPKNIYGNMTNSRMTDWRDLKINSNATCEIGFNRLGPVAVRIANL